MYNIGVKTGAKSELFVKGLNENMYKAWLEYVDSTPATLATYNRSLKQFLKYLEQNNITHPTRNNIIDYKIELSQRLKATTVQNYLAALKLFFQFTEEHNLYPNITYRVKGVKIEPGFKKDYLTLSQVKLLLNTIDVTTIQGKRDYAIILLMITTGLRTISVARANIADIRQTSGNIIALYYQGKGRNGKYEYVKLAPEVNIAIQNYLACRDDKIGPLFGSLANKNNGARLTTRSISRIIKENLLKAGLNSSRLTAHSLRHTTATLNILNGASLEETQQLLGHSNINTTMVYAHMLERAKNNSEIRIASTIFKE